MIWRVLFFLLSLLHPDAKGLLIVPAVGQIGLVEPVAIVDRDYDMSVIDADDIGHLDGTAWPGQWGRVGLAAHSPGVGQLWYPLAVGDRIYLIDTHQVAAYEVTGGTVVDVSAWQVLAPTAQPSLVLVTCFKDRRAVVIAEPPP